MAVDYTLRDQRMMSAARNYFAWQARLVMPELGTRVLEMGCGIGNFTRFLLDRDLVVAVDVERECVERLRARFADSPNLRAMVTDDASLAAPLGLNCCVCLNVLEHIEDDAEALRRMSLALEPGSPVVLLVPAFPALYGPIDRNLGHFRRYTKRSLAACARAAGLSVERMRYMNAVGFAGWWANARLFRRTGQSEAQIRFFDRWVVPVMSRVEEAAPPPFGQSLFAVLRRP